MKIICKISSILFISVCIAVASCSIDSEDSDGSVNLLAFDTINFEPSMKGWELYSWPDRENYSHSLMVGTNRLKTYNEVISNRYVVYGTDSLKMLLERLPEEESVFWVGRDWLESCWGSQPKGDLRVPVKWIVDEIEGFCIKHELELSVGEN
jgi:hypothetical protein